MSFIKFILVVGIVNIGVAVVFSGIGAAAMEANSSTLAFIGVAVLPALFYWTYIKLYKK